MSNERAELANLIASNLDRLFGKREFGPAQQDIDLADELLAAGYRKPRTITTAEELDALPIWSVVRDGDGWVWEACSRTWAGENPKLTWDGPEWGDRSEDIALPATVLYEPEQAVSEP
jgi:hypothetical protein